MPEGRRYAETGYRYSYDPPMWSFHRHLAMMAGFNGRHQGVRMWLARRLFRFAGWLVGCYVTVDECTAAC